MRILLAEDMPDTRELLRTLLEVDGHFVTEASNGSEAVDAALNCMPELILMDLRMPVMDGYTATRKIRHDGHSANIPIVAISAEFSADSSQKALAAGCDFCAGKPCSLEQLRSLLNRVERAAA